MQQHVISSKALVFYKNDHFKVVAHQTFIRIFEKSCLTWQPITQFVTAHRQAITALAISNDGELIVSGSSDCTLNIYGKTYGGLWTNRANLLLHSDSIIHIQIFEDGSIESVSTKETILWKYNEVTSSYEVDGILRS